MTGMYHVVTHYIKRDFGAAPPSNLIQSKGDPVPVPVPLTVPGRSWQNLAGSRFFLVPKFLGDRNCGRDICQEHARDSHFDTVNLRSSFGKE